MMELNWNRGTPTVVGTYFVAAEYAPGTGMFEIMDWVGDKWDCHSTIKVVAYLAWDEFKQQLDLKWPGDLPPPPPRRPLTAYDTDFQEV